MPDIEEVLVTGQQDELAGQVIVAFIKTKNNRPPNREAISEKLKQLLSSLKQPDKIMQVHEFEYSSTGKKILFVRADSRQEIIKE